MLAKLTTLPTQTQLAELSIAVIWHFAKVDTTKKIQRKMLFFRKINNTDKTQLAKLSILPVDRKARDLLLVSFGAACAAKQQNCNCKLHPLDTSDSATYRRRHLCLWLCMCEWARQQTCFPQFGYLLTGSMRFFFYYFLHMLNCFVRRRRGDRKIRQTDQLCVSRVDPSPDLNFAIDRTELW